MARSVKHLLDDLLSTLSIVYLLNDALVDCFTLTAEAGGKFESIPLWLRHDDKLLNDGLYKLNCAVASFDVVVIIMSIFFDTV
jgi:hypothetical protein